MFKKIAPLLIGAFVGIMAVLIVKNIGGSVWQGAAYPDAPVISGFWSGIGLLAILPVLVMFTILLHEFGHIAAALLVGSRVTRLYIGPFSFLFPERRIRFTFKNKYFFGAMQNEILSYRDEASFVRAIRAQRIVYAAGPAFSLATGLAAWAAATEAWSLLGGYAVFSIGIGLATLFSDGVSAWLLGRRNYALVSAWGVLVQAESLDESKLEFLRSASKSELEAMKGRARPATGRETFDLYVLYYALLTAEYDEDVSAMSFLANETESDWPPAAKMPKMQRDAMMMVLSEEVVRLCAAGQRERASKRYAKLAADPADESSTLLLKARAFVEESAVGADAYMKSIHESRSDLASFGALCEYEERRLRGQGLWNSSK